MTDTTLRVRRDFEQELHRKQVVRAVLAGTIGSTIEVYDFLLMFGEAHSRRDVPCIDGDSGRMASGVAVSGVQGRHERCRERDIRGTCPDWYGALIVRRPNYLETERHADRFA